MDENTNWPEFIKRTLDIEPRRMVKKALQYFGDFSGSAVDLGCGSGIDTLCLVERGWKVYAFDSTSDGFKNIMAKLPDEKKDNVVCIQSSFEDISIPEVDLVYSSFSIPFCKPEHFGVFWEKIVSSIRPHGRFSGNLFGPKDEWAYMTDATFLNKEQVTGLFDSFEIEYFREQHQEGESVLTQTKLWHLFEIVARKN